MEKNIVIVSGARTDWPQNPDAMVILGAGVNGTEPSLSLLSRLEAALYYIGQDTGRFPIVVTGSQGPDEEISEAACMARWPIPGRCWRSTAWDRGRRWPLSPAITTSAGPAGCGVRARTL